ncbi:MAG: ABC transporter ATP-binding protein [Legionellales bacterium]|nr:ABC transporter ATP-binding protein [Legionellales bacterium]
MIRNAIEVSNVSKIYKLYNSPKDRLKEALSFTNKKLHKDFYALKNVSFSLKNGDTLGVIGKNGSGKSTLLKIVAGILHPSSGDVMLNGKTSALIELGSGFNPEFTGLENIYFYSSILGFSKEEIDKKIDDIISFADIGEFLTQKIKTYSSGMKSRLAFSVAIATKPEILIIDEVLSVGDMFFKQKCINKLRELLNTGLTLFFVSHSINDIKSLCNKALYLDNGEQIAFGEAEDVCNLYQNAGSAQKEVVLPARENIKNEPSRINITSEKLFHVDANFDKFIVHRSGDHKLKFTSVKIIDENENETNTITSYSIFKIRLSILANENVPSGACVGILIRDDAGNDICPLNSNFENVYLPKFNKNDTCVYEVKLSLPLSCKTYSISAGIKPKPYEDYFYDRCFNVTALNIEKADWQCSTGGVIYIRPQRIKLFHKKS